MLHGKSRTRALHSGHTQDEEEEREKEEVLKLQCKIYT